MKLYFPVTVDLYNIYPLPIMNTQQYNIGRGALVTLTAAGQLVVPSTEQLYIYAKKKDGTLVYASCTLSGDQIRVDYDEQMTAVPGTMQMELQMIDGNGNSITTPIFLVNVQPSNIDYKAITSSDEFTALLDALEKVESAANSSGITTTDTEGIVGAAGENVSNQAIIDALAERAVSDRSMLSDAFSVEKAYAVGDYAIYENTLYKFTSAKTAGAWDTAKVQAVTVAGELNSLSEDLASANTQIDELNGKMGVAISPYSSIFLMNVTDLNNPPDAIIFMSSPTSVGYPSTLGGNRCIVLYLNAGDTYQAQLAFGFGSDRIAIRRKIHTTTWTEWKYFTAS